MTVEPRIILVPIFWLLFIGYLIVWLIVALESDPTWWWFVPVYGHYKIFGESVWWGLFDLAFIAFVIVGGVFVSDG